MSRFGVVFTVMLGAGFAFAASESPPFLTPGQIADRAKSSNAEYRIQKWDSRDASPDLFWRLRQKPAVNPVVTADPARHVTEFPFDEEALALLSKAEPLFQAGRCDEAKAFYQEAVRRSPRCYLALLSLGDCALRAHDAESALAYYKHAHEINPFDYGTVLFQGTALLDLGRTTEARAAYIEALAMKPRQATILTAIKNRSDALGVSVIDEPFVPKVSVRARDGGVDIGWDPPTGSHWMAFGLCKGMWRVDPAHRRDMLGSEEDTWSNVEEEECFASLLGVYTMNIEKHTVGQEPNLDRLRRVLQAKLLDGFILYEIGSRVDPHIMLTATDSERRQVREYIERYVIVGRR